MQFVKRRQLPAGMKHTAEGTAPTAPSAVEVATGTFIGMPAEVQPPPAARRPRRTNRKDRAKLAQQLQQRFHKQRKADAKAKKNSRIRKQERKRLAKAGLRG